MESLSNDKEQYAVRNIYCESLWTPKHAASFMSCPHHGYQSMKLSCPHCPPVGPLIPASHKSSPGCRTTSGSYPLPSELQVPLTSAHSPPDPVRAHSRRSIDPTSPAKSPVPSPLQSHRRRRLLGRAPSPVEPDNPLSDSRQHRSRVCVSTRSQRETHSCKGNLASLIIRDSIF